MENERELLELAAKAAEVHIDRWHGDGGDFWKGFPREVGKEAKGVWVRWNPLTSDGDALRLAVKLGLSFMSILTVGRDAATMEFDDLAAYSFESNGTDPYAATRRAITRAAAEIAKASHG
jgi:hypothetical protein